MTAVAAAATILPGATAEQLAGQLVLL